MSDIVAQDVELAKIAERIRTRMKRTVEDIIEIGRDLIAAKERIGHGGFGDWLEAEFDMSDSAATKFMQSAERFGGKNVNFTNLPTSVLYLLAAPSTPDPIVEKVTSGEIPATTAAVKEAIAKAKAAEKDAAAARKALTEQQEEYAAAQARAASLARTIDSLKTELEQAKPKTIEKIVEKPDPKQAKRIKELEAQLEAAERDKDAAEQHAQAVQAQAEANLPEVRARARWESQATQMGTLLREALAYLPAQEDLAAFGSAEWRRMDDLEYYAQQIIAAIQKIRNGATIIDVEAA